MISVGLTRSCLVSPESRRTSASDPAIPSCASGQHQCAWKHPHSKESHGEKMVAPDIDDTDDDTQNHPGQSCQAPLREKAELHQQARKRRSPRPPFCLGVSSKVGVIDGAHPRMKARPAVQVKRGKDRGRYRHDPRRVGGETPSLSAILGSAPAVGTSLRPPSPRTTIWSRGSNRVPPRRRPLTRTGHRCSASWAPSIR